MEAWETAPPVAVPNSQIGSRRRSPTQPPTMPRVSLSGVVGQGPTVHYDGEHAIKGYNLTTVQVGSCPLRSPVFVYERDRKRHQCPNKPHSLEDLEKMQSHPSGATAVQVPIASVQESLETVLMESGGLPTAPNFSLRSRSQPASLPTSAHVLSGRPQGAP